MCASVVVKDDTMATNGDELLRIIFNKGQVLNEISEILYGTY